MQDICGKLSRTAAVMVILLAACAGSAWAATGYAGGVPWQVGDIIVCFGNGTCNVLRITSTGPVLLDQFSDGLGGNTFGVGINNTLHAVVTDDSTTSPGTGSNVLVFSIASLNPNNNPATAVAHTPLYNYNGNSGGSTNVRAVAINNAGNFFVLNGSVPNIVELGPGPLQSLIATIPLSACTFPQATTSMDLSADGNSAYITSGGTIWKVSIPGGACTKFADFGANVTLYGIKDIPPQALPPTCGSAITNPAVSCPTDETLLVVATGDTDVPESGETDNSNDAVNICTNSTAPDSVSCALLLDTNPNPGLTASLWHAGQSYSSTDSILDPFLHLQTVLTPGTSGGDEPNFTKTTQTTIDNAVIWTDIVQPIRHDNNPYTVLGTPPSPNVAAVAGTYFVDPNGNLETVSGKGTSGPVPPGTVASPANPSFWSTSGGTTIDGLQWQDKGYWQANTQFAVGALAGDAGGHVHTVLTSGTSAGNGAVVPTGTTVLPGWNDTGTDTNGGLTTAGVTIDNAVVWTNEGPVKPYGAVYYPLNSYTAPNGHVQQAIEPGTSGGAANFSINGTSGGRTIDNAVTWADLGPAIWLASFNYGLNAIIVDSTGNVQQVTTAGASGPGPQPSFSSSPTTDGLQWSLVQPNATAGQYPDWQANTFYCSCPGGTAPFFQYPPTGDIWQAVSFGTSGSTEPTFYAEDHVTPISPQPIADNAVVWTSQGPKSGFDWVANHAYALNVQIVDPGNHVQLVSVAGTSGPNSPTFQDGSTTVDGTAGTAVTWTNLGMAVWRPTFSYGLNAIIVDPAGNVQQATTGGTTASSQPPFNATQGMTTPDGTVTWTNEGPLSGNLTFTWQAGKPYSLNAAIVDPATQVELATTAGTSGGSTPTFADGGNVVDGLVWLDIGPVLTWTPNATYTATVAAPFTLVIGNGFVQQATTTGNAGASSQPNWNATIGGKTVDGLQWTDQGQSVWHPGQAYSIGDPLISESVAPYHAEMVYESGKSGPTAFLFNHGSGALTPDNAVTWTESHPTRGATPTPYVTGAIVLDTFAPIPHVQQVTSAYTYGAVQTGGTTGPSPNPFGFNDGGKTAIDGLQWTNAPNPLTSVVARYPVNTPTLKSVALDPLITDCTGNNCLSTVPPPTASNFWLGDSQYSNVYKLDFATGTPLQYPANGNCTSPCVPQGGVQGIGIYGGEGSNQPDLTKVLSSAVNGTANNQTAFFPLPNDGVTSNTNSLTLSLYNGTTLAPSLPAFAVYGSSVPLGSCFFDGTPSLPCTATTAGGNNAVVWKNDIPLPVGNNPPLRLNPSTQTLAYSFDVPPAFQSVNNNVFVDSSYNTTTGVGLDYPSGRYPSSTGIGTPVNAQNQQPTDFGCTYQSPTPKCFKNPGTIPVKFVCSKLPGVSLQTFASTVPYGPRLQIVTPATAPPAQFCTGAAPSQANATKLSGGNAPNVGICPTQLPSSNGKNTYRFDSSALDWVFNWSVPSTNTRKTYHVCTYDDSHNASTFCIDITVASSCP